VRVWRKVDGTFEITKMKEIRHPHPPGAWSELDPASLDKDTKDAITFAKSSIEEKY